MNIPRACCISIAAAVIAAWSALYAQESTEGAAFDQSKFVPDIAFILDMSAVTRSIGNERYAALVLPGFDFPSTVPLGTSGTDAHRGFNFNYGELSLASTVDPYFDLFTVITFTPGTADLEEAYFSTRSLPYGFKLKAGKFLASFGRINEQHEHYWNFDNRPLIGEALFGDEGLNEIGVQATWVAPTSFFLMLGAESMTGTNARSFGTVGFADPAGRYTVDPVQGPNLSIGFIRTSTDIGDATILAGFSGAFGTARSDDGYSLSGASGTALDARSTILGTDLTVKYQLDAIRAVTVQGEYMHRSVDGTAYAHDAADASSRSALTRHQSGFYAQAVARLDQRWDAGVRYDLLMQNDVASVGTTLPLPSNLPRYSLMIDFQPTEFSRLRLQLDRDESRYIASGGSWLRQPFTQIDLQANLTIGAHGAHAF